jgi:hypothetical protein
MQTRTQRVRRAIWLLWWMLLVVGWAIIPYGIPADVIEPARTATSITYMTTWLLMLVGGYAWLSHRDADGASTRLEHWLDQILVDDYDEEETADNDESSVPNGVPNTEHNPVQAVPMRYSGVEQPGSAANYSEPEIAAMLARILADVRRYSGSPGRYGTSRIIEQALGLKRGGGQEYAAWASRIEAELRRLNGQIDPPSGPIVVNDRANGSYTLERS